MKNFELNTIVNYVKDYHTDELVELLMENRNDRKEIINISAAIALRNGYRTLTPKTAFRAIYSTDHMIEKINEKWYSSALSEREKKNKVAHYCAAIAIRNGLHDEWPTLVKLVLKFI